MNQGRFLEKEFIIKKVEAWITTSGSNCYACCIDRDDRKIGVWGTSGEEMKNIQKVEAAEVPFTLYSKGVASPETQSGWERTVSYGFDYWIPERKCLVLKPVD